MVCFVACSLIEELILMEDLSTKQGKCLNQKRAGKKVSKPTLSTEITLDDYACLMDKFINALIKIFDKNVHYLWEPPVIDDEFFRYILS